MLSREHSSNTFMQDLENYRAFALYLYVALERSKRTRSRCDISPGENQATTEAHKHICSEKAMLEEPGRKS